MQRSGPRYEEVAWIKSVRFADVRKDAVPVRAHQADLEERVPVRFIVRQARAVGPVEDVDPATPERDIRRPKIKSRHPVHIVDDEVRGKSYEILLSSMLE